MMYALPLTRVTAAPRFINATPERKAQWDAANKKAKEDFEERKRQKNKKRKRGKGKGRSGKPPSPGLDVLLDEWKKPLDAYMAEEKEHRKQNADMMKGINDSLASVSVGLEKVATCTETLQQGMAGIVANQQQTTGVLSQMGQALAKLLQDRP